MIIMGHQEKVLIFDLVGSFAHFRKFYTNSSSLSYHFPPRPTLEGIIAAMIGLDRDSYYDLFLPSKCLIAVSTKNSTRTIMQTVNYLSVKGQGDFSGRGHRTQVPIEIVVPENIHEELRYRVYFYHDNIDLTREVGERIRHSNFHYPISLGPANFLCHANFVAEGDMLTYIENRNINDNIEIINPIPVEAIHHFGLLNNREISHKFVQDIFPFHFESGRMPGKNIKLVYEKDYTPVKIQPVDGLRFIRYFDGSTPINEAIVFTEDWIG